jgi:hypothetical protein
VLLWVDDSKHQFVTDMWPPTDEKKTDNSNKNTNKKQPNKKK